MDDWKEKWLRYCEVELGVKNDPRDLSGKNEAKKDWILHRQEILCHICWQDKGRSENLLDDGEHSES